MACSLHLKQKWQFLLLLLASCIIFFFLVQQDYVTETKFSKTQLFPFISLFLCIISLWHDKIVSFQMKTLMSEVRSDLEKTGRVSAPGEAADGAGGAAGKSAAA